jgi:hypothetical protein
MEAFTDVTYWGHRRGHVAKHSFLAHRVIWKIMTGREPPPVVDHKDRDGQNNRWENLREATTSQNCINTTRAGVNPRRNGKWRARATLVDGKRIHLGDFNSREEAVQARAEKHRELHGEFAP